MEGKEVKSDSPCMRCGGFVAVLTQLDFRNERVPRHDTLDADAYRTVRRYSVVCKGCGFQDADYKESKIGHVRRF